MRPGGGEREHAQMADADVSSETRKAKQHTQEAKRRRRAPLRFAFFRLVPPPFRTPLPPALALACRSRPTPSYGARVGRLVAPAREHSAQPEKERAHAQHEPAHRALWNHALGAVCACARVCLVSW